MRGMGFPLYVNGQQFSQPVTISHVPGPAEAQGVLGGGGIDPSMGGMRGMGAYASYRPTRGMRGLRGYRGYGDDPTTTTTTVTMSPATITATVPAIAPLNPEAQPPAPTPPPPSTFTMPALTPVVVGLGLLDLLSTAALIYHGYRRNRSIFWALVWGVVGGAVPIIAWPVAIAQGFNQPRSGLTPNRRKRGRSSGRRRARRRTRRSRR